MLPDPDKLKEAIQQRNRELALLNWVGQVFSSRFDLEQVLRTVLAEMRDLLGVTGTSFWLVFPETGELVCQQASGPGSEALRGWRLAPGQGITGVVARTGESLIIQDTWADKRHFRGAEKETGLLVRSLISIPVRSQGAVIGVLNLVDTHIGRFNQDDLRLLESLVASATIAMENARLHTAVQAELAERHRAELALQQLNEELEWRVNERTQALQESEARFRRVITSISDHIYMTEITASGERRNLYLSPNVETLTGYPRQKLLADWHFWSASVIHPEDTAMAADHAQRLVESQGGEIEYRLIRADNRVIWVRDSARVEHQGASKIVYGIVGDITARKQAEAELWQHRDHLEDLIRDRTRDLAALYEVTATTNRFIDLQLILDHVLEKALEVMRSQVGLLHLIDEDGETLRLAAHQGLSSDFSRLLRSQPPEETLWQQVIRSNQTMVIPDLLADIQPFQATYPQATPAYIGVPIQAKGRTVGVLSVFGETIQKFSAEDIALLAAIADHIGVAVDNAHLRQWAEAAAVMEERQRLARELHDSVTQSLYSLTLFAAAAQHSTDVADLAEARHYLGRLGETAQQALREMRLLIYELRPPALEQEGLTGALRRRLDTVERRAGMEIDLSVEIPVELPARLEMGLYGIAQEALNNVLKHAMATRVTVTIGVQDDLLSLEVADNGRGFDSSSLAESRGIGLSSMQERTEKLGGQFLITSRPGMGTRVRVTFQTPAPADSPDQEVLK